jgi:hypothetical protein
MPHRRKKHHNGVPNAKLPMSLECVLPPSVPEDCPDASLRDTAIVPIHFVCVSTDATPDVSMSSPSNVIQVPGSSDSDFVDGSYVSLDASALRGVSLDAFSTSPCQFTCPDLNPLFDVFDELDHLLANLSFLVADDLFAFLHDQPIGMSLTMSSTCSSSLVCLPASCCSTLPSSANDGLSLSSTCSSSDACLPDSCGLTLSSGADDRQFVQEVLSLCCHHHDLLIRLSSYYQLYEVACLGEIDDMRVYIDSRVRWSPDFILCCFGEFFVFFEHFASNRFPLFIEVIPE